MSRRTRRRQRTDRQAQHCGAKRQQPADWKPSNSHQRRHQPKGGKNQRRGSRTISVATSGHRCVQPNGGALKSARSIWWTQPKKQRRASAFRSKRNGGCVGAKAWRPTVMPNVGIQRLPKAVRCNDGLERTISKELVSTKPIPSLSFSNAQRGVGWNIGKFLARTRSWPEHALSDLRAKHRSIEQLPHS
jgi:hypothetical protein